MLHLKFIIRLDNTLLSGLQEISISPTVGPLYLKGGVACKLIVVPLIKSYTNQQ